LHGHQLRLSGGRHREMTVDPHDQARMRAAVQALAARMEDVQLEDKQHAMALHCRRAPERLPALRAAAEAVAADLSGYELQPGNFVVEFKPAGMDKGRVVEELMQAPPFAGRMPVYLGDDLTDEHAFAAVNRADGISVRVGQREPSRARFTLPSPVAVQAWLERVRDTLGNLAPGPLAPEKTKGVSIDANTHGGQPPTHQP
jgi:trehalose 6-phosphate phosphatase